MSIRLLKLTITSVYLIGAIDSACLHPVASMKQHTLRPMAFAVSKQEAEATVKELQKMADRIEYETDYAVHIARLYYEWLNSTEVDKGEIWRAEVERRLVADEEFVEFMELLAQGNNIEEFLNIPGEETALGDEGDIGIPVNMLVDGEDINEAIELLRDGLGYKIKYDRVRYLADKRFKSPERQSQWQHIREQWQQAEDLLQILEALVPTESCDWDDEDIRQKANEIIKRLRDKLGKESISTEAKAEAIEDWVRRNVGFALGYGAYRDAKASETLESLIGGSFNRANLIVAMLRSVGVPARYRIMRFKKDVIKGMIPPRKYARMDKETEDLVAEAYINGSWTGLAGEAFIKNRWVKLEEIEAKEVGESVYTYNIDEFAGEKAKKDSRQEQDETEDYRIRKLRPFYHPDNILNTFIKRKGCPSWYKIPAVWLRSDLEVLIKELTGLRGGVKALAELLDTEDFKEPVFKAGPRSEVSLSGLLNFIQQKYGLETEKQAMDKIRELAGIEKGHWYKEDWQEVQQALSSLMEAADSQRIKSRKDLEEYFYAGGLREDQVQELARLIKAGKGNRAGLKALMMASYKQVEEFIGFCCQRYPKLFDSDKLMRNCLAELGKRLLSFDPETDKLSNFVDNILAEIARTYLGEPESGSAESPKASSAGKVVVGGEQPSREERLNMILQQNPEIDTAEKFLVYINKNQPHLLDAISEENRFSFLTDFIFLRYETEPLPREVSDELIALGRHCGRRIARIREARNKQPEDLLRGISEKIKKGFSRSKEEISDSAYSFIERAKGAPSPCQLFDIARELKVDPIRIIDGRDWVSASLGLTDNEKMKLCRLRKGWNQQECAIALGKAGLDFSTKSISTRTQWVSRCERGKILPDPEQAEAIRRVFCDRTLFGEVVKKAEAKAAAPAKGLRKKPVAEAGKPIVKGEELSRQEKLKLILEKNLELDTADKLLAYVNKYEPHLLDAISREKRLEFLRDFIFLGYETVPLSKVVLEQLPGMTAEGARMDAIRKARKMEEKEVCKLAGINKSVYVNMTKNKDFYRPENVFKIAKALKVDAIYIKKAKSWNEVAPDLEDKEKMFLCRFRKGWTQKDFVVKLEEAGLKFGTDKMRSKKKIVKSWESGELTPKPEERKIIRKVLGESTLYEKADEIEKAMPEGQGLVVEPSEEGGPKYLRGVWRTKTHIFFAEHWQQVKGLTPSDIERDFDIPAVSTRAFLRQNDGAAEIYDIDFSGEEKKPQAENRPEEKEKLFPPPAAKEKRPRVTAEEAAEEAEAEEARVTAEKIDVRRPPRLMPDEPEATYLTGYANIIYEWLKSDQDRDLVDGLDIEEVISDLEYLCYKAQAMIEKEPDPEKQKGLRERWRWIEARDLLRKFKPLVSTRLCDWDEPEIREKANDITKGLVDDLDKARAIENWVRKNIDFSLGYGGYWDATASETLEFLKGTCFNRANLIVAMLRSISIPCRYRIMGFRREMVKDMLSPKRYAKVAGTTEHIVAEALIEDRWVSLTSETFLSNRWVSLKEIESEEVGESVYLYDIDKFALKKAEKDTRKSRDKMEDYRRRKAQQGVTPPQEMKAFMAISQAA